MRQGTEVEWADSLPVPACGTQELFTKFGTESKLELSSFRGRAVRQASRDSNWSLGRFRFWPRAELGLAFL